MRRTPSVVHPKEGHALLIWGVDAIGLCSSAKVISFAAVRNGLLMSLGVFLAACYEAETDQISSRVPHTIALTEARPAGGHLSHTFVGNVQSSERVRLAFAQAGSIDVTNAEIGDHVASGAELARLELQPFERRLEQARAGADRARAAFEDLQQRHAAQQSLFGRGFVPRLTFESIAAQLEGARADVRASSAELELSERMVREARILSPISGRVALRMAEPGEFVQSGQTIFEIDGEGTLEAVVPIPAAMAAQLSQGGDVLLRSAGMQTEGSVLHIGERLGRGGLVIVEVQIGSSARGFYPGAAVEARFVLAPERAEMVEIPLSAFLPGDEPGRGAVFLFDHETRRVVRLEVTATPADGQSLHTPSLRSGMFVVSAGVRFLDDGDLAEPLPLTAE